MLVMKNLFLNQKSRKHIHVPSWILLSIPRLKQWQMFKGIPFSLKIDVQSEIGLWSTFSIHWLRLYLNSVIVVISENVFLFHVPATIAQIYIFTFNSAPMNNCTFMQINIEMFYLNTPFHSSRFSNLEYW